VTTNSGYFIVVEGLDGSGKTEMSRRLAQALREELGAEKVLLTCEPHLDSAAGGFLRAALGHRVRPLQSWTLALAFAANRADHTARVIAPFLAAGSRQVVICDRYYLSSLVNQSNEDASPAEVMALNRQARRPHLILFLNASNETCYRRMDSREKDPEMFEDQLDELREKYVACIDFLRVQGETVEIVDADAGIPVVLENMLEQVRKTRAI